MEYTFDKKYENSLYHLILINNTFLNIIYFYHFDRRDFEISQNLSKIEDEQSIGTQLQKKIKELQVIHCYNTLC